MTVGTISRPFAQSSAIMPHSFPQRSLTMPNVFVIPPEEDPEEPWCYFSVQQQPLDDDSDDSDELGLDAAMELIGGSSPASYYSNKESKDTAASKINSRRSERPFSDLDLYDEQEITIRASEPGNSSEVIEVVKVKRHRDAAHPQPPVQSMKRSATFMSRAFRSIKNVGKPSVSRTKKPTVTDVFAQSDTSPPSAAATVSDNSKPRARKTSRRGSVVLAQLFTQQPSQESFHSSQTPSRPISILDSFRRSSSSTHLADGDDCENDVVDLVDDDMRSASPTPSTLTQTQPDTFSPGARRRFSVMNLFARASSPTPAAPNTPFMSNGPSNTSCSSFSSAGPSTPVEVMHARTSMNSLSTLPDPYAVPPPAQKPQSVPLLKRIPSFSRRGGKDQAAPARGSQKQVVADRPPIIVVEGLPPRLEPALTPADNEGGEISFEMRLDSLHFDELSFDADRFS